MHNSELPIRLDLRHPCPLSRGRTRGRVQAAGSNWARGHRKTWRERKRQDWRIQSQTPAQTLTMNTSIMLLSWILQAQTYAGQVGRSFTLSATFSSSFNGKYDMWHLEITTVGLKHTHTEIKQKSTQLPNDKAVNRQRPSACSSLTPCQCERAPHCACEPRGQQCTTVHGCVRAASLPHLVAIRMCASVTAARQRKCLPQMEGWKEGTEEMVQNRRRMAASHRQTANQTRLKAGGKDVCRKERMWIGGGGGKRKKANSAIVKEVWLMYEVPSQDGSVVYHQQRKVKVKRWVSDQSENMQGSRNHHQPHTKSPGTRGTFHSSAIINGIRPK